MCIRDSAHTVPHASDGFPYLKSGLLSYFLLYPKIPSATDKNEARLPKPVSYTHLDVYKRQHTGTDRIINIVIDIGNLIRQPDNGTLQRGWMACGPVI